MDEKYDIIFLGTGLKECVLAGLLGKEGKKILHIDRNNYYGAETTSFTPLEFLFKFFNQSTDNMDKYGRGREWNVDKIPKFLMADGQLVKILIHTKVTLYIAFKVVDGSYVSRGSSIYKVPSNDTESLKTGLLGMFEKVRYKDFLRWVSEYDQNEPNTYHGHALALNLNDTYLVEPAIKTIKRIQLYVSSLCRHGKSPFLYPEYGLGELPQGFARAVGVSKVVTLIYTYKLPLYSKTLNNETLSSNWHTLSICCCPIGSSLFLTSRILRPLSGNH
ncbi:hypothetical protein GJ496_011270 [Pomphorhynchus laevis]|nr:hypothetical protein GJ496_011270 [Pomphorhynchus laevis]